MSMISYCLPYRVVVVVALLFTLLLPLFENELYPLLLSNLIPILLL